MTRTSPIASGPITYRTARCILVQNDRYLLAVHSRFWRSRHRRWGLPGGQIEHGESPRVAVQRELEEELQVSVPDLQEVGSWGYKGARHMVFTGRLEAEITDFDRHELLDIRWFTEAEVVDLQRRRALHADYELDAIRRLPPLAAPMAAAAGA